MNNAQCTRYKILYLTCYVIRSEPSDLREEGTEKSKLIRASYERKSAKTRRSQDWAIAVNYAIIPYRYTKICISFLERT